jgi:hypothetical protein
MTTRGDTVVHALIVLRPAICSWRKIVFKTFISKIISLILPSRLPMIDM